MAALHSGSGRNELTVALCLMKEGEKGRDLFAFASPDDERELVAIAARIEREGAEPEELFTQVQKMQRFAPASSLDEVHPGWILEKLEEESPRVIGILCRTLPGDRVKYLIEHLSEEQRKHLPKINESYRVSNDINQIVRRVVEKSLPSASPASRKGSFSFPHIVVIKSDDLRSIFRDLGVEEIRKAFTNVEPRVLKAFLARFTPKMAKEIRDRIEYGSAVSTEVKQEAQRYLVSLPLEKLPVEELFKEIGYSAFARALCVEDLSWSEMIYQKLPPEEGYRLKRVFQETVKRRSAQMVETKKSDILARIFVLAEKGMIRKYWKSK